MEIKGKLTKKYVIFWCIYWGASMIFLLYNKDVFFKNDSGKFLYGPAGFWILVAVMAATAALCMLVLRPLRRWDEKGHEKKKEFKARHLLLLLALDTYVFVMMEVVNNEDFGIMAWGYRAVNVVGIFICNLILLFWLNSVRRSMISVLSIWTTFTIIFYAVYSLRGEPLQLIDFFSLGTALEVAGGYDFIMTHAVVADIVLCLCVMAVLLNFQDVILIRKKMGRLLMRVGVFVFMVFGYFFYLNANWNGALNILTDLFAPIKTYKEYGNTVGFFCVAKYMRLTPPDGYSVSGTEEIAKASEEEQEPNTVTDVQPVNIIAIMNESWADYRMVGDLQTNEEIMPYYDSMEENTIKGHTMVCIRGGGTAKSEYEFLTGNSVKRFPAMVPYVSYFTHDQYSLVTTLEAQGYESAAMHPYIAKNWNRPTAYKLLDFDTFYTEDDFDEDVEKVHGHISDKANYEKIIEVINSKDDPEQPFFLFDITMQNHGGYATDDFDGVIEVEGYYNEAVNRFLSLEKESDDALRYLIEYFKDYDQPTLIVMFGDHYPTLPDSFTEYISGSAYDDLEQSEQVKYFETPFFIWANYDIEEQSNVLTSTNFLGTMMLEQTGLEMADYNYYLKDLQQTIPALNHMGYYDADGSYYSWSKGTDEALEEERKYECLQYNNLAENRRRLDWFFGLENK